MTAAAFGQHGPLKIVRVITRLNIGGPARHVTFLTERLNDGTFSAALVAGALGRADGDMRSFAARRGVAVTSLSALGNDRGVADDLRALAQLYRLMRAERPAIAHLHLLKARFLGGIAARLAGVPVVVETLHGHLLTGYYGALKTRVVLAIERFLGRWIVDHVVVLSESQRQEVLRWRIASAEKIVVVPVGLELERLLSAPRMAGRLRRDLGIPSDRLVVGAVGRLVPIKGYDVLLQAVAKVSRATETGLVLLIAGDGPCRGALEAEARRLEISHCVRFLGWRSDVEEIYADLDIFVQPSINEGTPVALIEAMAAGVAVVATAVGGVPDVVEDGRSGVLVSPGDPAALAAALLTLSCDPGLRERLGAEARRQVGPRFSVDVLERDLRALYGRWVARARASNLPSVAEGHSIQPR